MFVSSAKFFLQEFFDTYRRHQAVQNTIHQPKNTQQNMVQKHV